MVIMDYKYLKNQLVKLDVNIVSEIKNAKKGEMFRFNIGSLQLFSIADIELEDNLDLPYHYLAITNTAGLRNKIWLADLIELVHFMKDFDVKPYEYSNKEENVWNDKNLVSFVFEILEKIHYSGIGVRKEE